MKNPKFSIIIPVYNASVYLRDCLDSIYTQTYTNYEIICINDGSTDNSENILNEYEQRWNKLKVVNQSNMGVSAARNRGIDEASGEYVFFVDADDYYLHKNVLNSVVEKLSLCGECDLIFFPTTCKLANGEVYTQMLVPEIFDFGWQCMEKYCCAKGVVFGSVFRQCFRRDVINQNKLRFDTHMSYGEDRLFVISYFFVAKYTIVNAESIYCYCVRSNSLMTSLSYSIESRAKISKDTNYLCHSLYTLMCSLPPPPIYIYKYSKPNLPQKCKTKNALKILLGIVLLHM